MPNRRGREVPTPDFDPRNNVAQPLGAIARPSGAEQTVIAGAAEQLASTLGRYADEAAVMEGKAAGAAAGNDPNFRPREIPTLRGKAFDEAAVKTYHDNLDAALRTNMQTAYEANRDDPVALKTAFEGLHADMSAKHVFPEVQGAFNKTFSTWSAAYRNQAQYNFEKNQDDDNRAGLLRNLSIVDDATKRAIVTLDPADPAVEGLVASGVARKQDLYGRAADAGAITQVAAEKGRRDASNQAYSGLVIGRAAKLSTPDELAAYREKFAADYANGKYKNKLDGDGFDAVDTMLQRMQSQTATALSTATTALSKGLDDFVKREAAGLTPPAEEWQSLVQTARGVPGGDAMLALADGKRALARQLLNSSVDQADAVMGQLRDKFRSEGGVDRQRAELIRFGDDLLKGERTALRTDQLGTAARRGIVAAVAPLDVGAFATSQEPQQSASMLAAQLRDRTAQAQAVGRQLDRAPQYLRPDEKQRIKEIVDQGGDRALLLAGAIAQGAGSDAPKVFNEIGEFAPVMAQVGGLIAEGGSLQAARDAMNAARMKHEKLKVTGPNSSIFDTAMRGELGTAFTMAPEDQSRTIATARAISETRLTVAQLDPKDKQAETLYKRAAQEAAGAVYVGDVQYGGVASYRPGYWTNYKVAVPAGVRADAFRDVLGTLRDDDLNTLAVPPQTADGKPYRMRDLNAAIPVAVPGPNGSLGYRFAMNDPASSDDPKFIRGADGRPFVLPFDRLAPELRRRLPRGFIGAN